MNSIASIRLAALTDAEELSRLNHAFNGGATIAPAKIIELLNSKLTELVAVAEISGKIVGFGCAQSYYSFCYKEPCGEITELYVEEAARRNGIAIAIISCLEESLRDRGVKYVKVLTGRGNTAAIRTYEHCNYIKDDDQMLNKMLEH